MKPTITRRPGERCDWCGESSPYVALTRYSVELPGWPEPVTGEALVCAACSQHSTRVALGHEAAR